MDSRWVAFVDRTISAAAGRFQADAHPPLQLHADDFGGHGRRAGIAALWRIKPELVPGGRFAAKDAWRRGSAAFAEQKNVCRFLQ